MSADRLRALVFVLVGLAAILALVGTLAESAVAGWLGVATLVAVLVVYAAWRRAVRRGRFTAG